VECRIRFDPFHFMVELHVVSVVIWFFGPLLE
jgi:hypothetical protein